MALTVSSSLPAGYFGLNSAVLTSVLSYTAFRSARMASVRFSSMAMTERLTQTACIRIFAPLTISSALSVTSREMCAE